MHVNAIQAHNKLNKYPNLEHEELNWYRINTIIILFYHALIITITWL